MKRRYPIGGRKAISVTVDLARITGQLTIDDHGTLHESTRFYKHLPRRRVDQCLATFRDGMEEVIVLMEIVCSRELERKRK